MTPWTVACQAPLSMGFPRQEDWSGFQPTPMPSSRDLASPGFEPMSPESPALAGGFFITEPPWKPGPITSWEIDGETVETVSDFIFLGSKITADGD